MIIELIDEAVAGGAPFGRACVSVGLAPTTVSRWKTNPEAEDARRGPNTPPANALSEEERSTVVALLNAKEHSSMSPATLVPHLATLGIYVASEATMYRIARKQKLLGTRGRARPRTKQRPREAVATGPNQV